MRLKPAIKAIEYLGKRAEHNCTTIKESLIFPLFLLLQGPAPAQGNKEPTANIEVRVEHLGDYNIRISYNDWKIKTVNLEKYMDKPVFQPLKDKSYFRKFN